MLFNSAPFIFGFLPVAIALLWLAPRLQGPAPRVLFMALLSVAFYAAWDWRFVPLLLGSIALNFLAGRAIHVRDGGPRQLAFFLAVSANLAALFFFKYLGFAVESLNWLLGMRLSQPGVTLPLGISFFTFTQIAYLADVYQRRAIEPAPAKYALFVTFFPHLIAGPILHHKEMMPQFETMKITGRNVAVGLSMFVFGLAKKMLLADALAPIAVRVFDAADRGVDFTSLEAWIGTLAYTFQLYFDFSGYSDMALGLGVIFGVRLPLNFNSPYKARNIIEFWQRWHMTLSRFLRDYLYIPLGGNRRGTVRRYANLMITMLLGGAWHGAGLNYILWGGLHGAYLVVNHAWRGLSARLPALLRPVASAINSFARPLTFLAVTVAWVPFRAAHLEGAVRLLDVMFKGPWVLPPRVAIASGAIASIAARVGVRFDTDAFRLVDPRFASVLLLAAAVIAFLLPNISELFSAEQPALNAPGPRSSQILWTPSWKWAAATAVLAASTLLSLAQPTQFLYFQF